MNKEPQDRQKELLKYMSENVGISMSQAMKDLGYSESYSNSPDKIKKTKGWKSLMRKYLPDRKLCKVVKQGLDANRIISAMNTGKQASGATSDFIEVPDHAVRHKFVETALKMKGKLIEKTDLTTNGKDLETVLVKFINNENDRDTTGV